MTRTRVRLVLSSCILTLAVASGVAQESPARVVDDQLGRIFDTNQYAVPRFGPARWRPDGVSYAMVEPTTAVAGGSDIVRYDAVTGAREVLVGGIRLTADGQTGPLPIDDYEWSPDGKRLLVFANTAKVWRDNTRGDYWVLDLDGSAPKKLGGAAPASSLMFAKFSPDGTRVAYVRANDIYVERLADGKITPLTKDGSETTINGTSDWVYEEELGVRDCFRWSPDGRSIAYWQFDSTGVGIFSLINNTDTLYPVITRIPYPKAGTTNSAARIGVVSAEGGKTKWLQTPGDPRQGYLARLDWIDAQTVAIQQLNRLQNQNDVLLGDARTGAVRRVFRDESKTWVEVVDGTEWLENGEAFIWVSERDGWRHVYRVPVASRTAPTSSRADASSGFRGAHPATRANLQNAANQNSANRESLANPVLLTRFDADILDVVGVDERGGWIYVTASPENATQQYLYRARLDGTGTPERVTPLDQPGTHSYILSPGAKMAFHTWSRFETPPVTDVIDLPGHVGKRALTETSGLVAKVAPLLKPAAEFFTVDIGGAALDGWMLKPSTFDPARKYPVVVHVYGEPANQTVLDRWGGSTLLFHRALAEAGYIVVSVDNRGTPAPKGAAWRKIVYGSVGDLSSKDQAAAVQALAARHPFIDATRIGVWGWSGGGSETLNVMFRFPEVFQVGVSVAPVPDQKLYDTIYQERYMGLPQDNVEGYRIGSPINFAEGLKGRLLVIHGTGDDNVHYQGTERLINRLIELRKPLDVMVYPNRTHSISQGSGTSVHVYRAIARYFLEHLLPGAR
jgi:dipeptidyl-peptidase-4